MRILLCKSHFAGPVSGSDETIVSYATNLKQGHQLVVVLLYAPAENDQYYARLKQAGVEVIAIASHPFLHNLLTRATRVRDVVELKSCTSNNAYSPPC